MPLAIRARLPETTDLLRLALPILGAQLAQAGMGTVDVMMAGNHGATTLAAVSVGSSLWMPLMLFMTGTLMGVTPIVAQHLGAERRSEIRPSVYQALWLALVLGIAALLALRWLAAPIFTVMSVPTEVARASSGYLQAVALGMPAVALYQALRAFSDGINHTRPALWISLIGLGVNIPCNYVLIFGGNAIGVSLPLINRIPPLGAVGCGLATAIAMWVMCLVMALYIRQSRAYAGIDPWRRIERPQVKRTGELLRIGLPIGVAIFTEVTLFAVIALFVASLGETVVAAHQVALNFTSLLFMLPLSLGMALTVRVGNTLGQGDGVRARFVAWNGVAVALIAALLIDIVLIAGAHPIVALYSDSPAVRTLAANLVLMAAIYQISDALQVSMAGALRGYKDTRIIMLITLASYWIVGLGGGHLLGGSGLGVYGYWIGLIAGLSCAAALLGWRLQRTASRQLQAPAETLSAQQS
ncbi:MATE family efflux transporter [Kushneria aurantia]|uniref:Multidrug-efflux transporter n=1 Tax=Kushneria aurantia TaxID=504092 RepID=A0ABV6G5D5_9GAMM|nr:MATE family efflux transporter [Kushneria aurantia]